MKSCVKCHGSLQETEVEKEVTVSGQTIYGQVPAYRCDACGELYFEAKDLLRFDLRAARELGRLGVHDGDSFRYMRKTLGLRASDLASMLGLSAETISRWERGERAVDRAAFTVLAALVSDKLDGRAATMNFLRAQQEPRAKEHTRVSLSGK